MIFAKIYIYLCNYYYRYYHFIYGIHIYKNMFREMSGIIKQRSSLDWCAFSNSLKYIFLLIISGIATIRFDILNKNRWVHFSVIYFGLFLLVYYLPQHDSISAPILDWTFQLPSKYHRKQHGLHFFESLPKNHSRSSMRL